MVYNIVSRLHCILKMAHDKKKNNWAQCKKFSKKLWAEIKYIVTDFFT